MINSETELWTKESLPSMVLSGASDHAGSNLCLRALVLRTPLVLRSENTLQAIRKVYQY